MVQLVRYKLNNKLEGIAMSYDLVVMIRKWIGASVVPVFSSSSEKNKPKMVNEQKKKGADGCGK